MGKAMVRRAIEEKIPFRWVTADAAYGFSKGWRFALGQADVFRVMATTGHDTVVTRWALDHPVHDLFTGLARQKWKRRSCGDAGADNPEDTTVAGELTSSMPHDRRQRRSVTTDYGTEPNVLQSRV